MANSLTLGGSAITVRYGKSVGDGGMRLTGSFSCRSTNKFVYASSGKLNLGGTARVFFVVGSGGLRLTGTANIRSSAYRTSGDGKLSLENSAVLVVHDYAYHASGGLNLYGSSQAVGKFHYLYYSNGLLLFSDSADYGIILEITKDFSWDIAGEVLLEKSFTWNVEQAPLAFYRVVGKCKPTTCPPITSSACDGKNSQFITYMLARGLRDICTKLSSRGFVSPIKSITRFSQNPTGNQTDDCNVGVDIDVNPINECIDFLIDFRADTLWTMDMRFLPHYEHVASGGLNLSGQYENLRYFYLRQVLGDGGFVTKGSTRQVSSAYNIYPSGGFVLSGQPRSASSYHHFVATGRLRLYLGEVAIGSGTISLSGSAKVKFRVARRAVGKLLLKNSFSAFIKTPAFKALGLGGLHLSSSSRSLGSYHTTQMSGKIMLAGSYRAVSSSWHHLNSGALNLRGSVKPSIRARGAGFIKLTASGLVKLKPKARANGSLILSGTSLIISNRYTAHINGQLLRIGGEANVICSDLGTISDGASTIDAEIFDIKQLFSPVPAPPVQAASDLISVACCNDPIPLVLRMTHNLDLANNLNQFLARSSLVLPKNLKLLYDRALNSWRTNIHYKGISSSSQVQVWNLLFELACVDEFALFNLNENMWKFSVQISNKNLTTQEDFLTKIVLLFSKNDVCLPRHGFFEFKFNVDTTTTVATLNRQKAKIFNDDASLFRSAFWKKNPLKFQISSILASEGAKYTDVTRFFNVF